VKREAQFKALALYSGGLDSTLAILVLLNQGVEVEALSFTSDFGCGKNREWILETSERFGFRVDFIDLGEKLIGVVKNPKYGYGKNMNPCIDCRILMLKEAKNYMEERGARFIITGEVLNQRPLSQRKEILELIDREAGLEGYVLRPLSALRLEPTVPEKENLINRELLYGFEGRSRKPQMELAKKFGLFHYPTPAGGCLLTDPIYSFRLKELLRLNPGAERREIELLKVGRHFRIASSAKVIVGRNKRENEILESLAKEGELILKTVSLPGPTVLVVGEAKEEEIKLAASICARYSNGKDSKMKEVMVYRVIVQKGKKIEEPSGKHVVENIDYEAIESLLIAP